jgi:glycosyltransferase involved in cell wall biosynthesis
MPMMRHKPARVLMLVENCSYPRDVRVRREAESLAGAGCDVSVICPALKGQARREKVNGVRVYRYAAPPEARGQLGYVVEYGYSLLAAFVLALRIAVREGIDVIHAANPPDLFVLIAVLFKPFGVKFIYDQHDLAPDMYRARYSESHKTGVESALRLFERWSYKLADQVVVANESYRESAGKRGKIPAGQVAIVRNGPDAKQLERSSKGSEYRGEPKQVIIAYLGLMGVQDGVVHLIRAMDHLVHKLGATNCKCKLIGDGEERVRLEALVQTLKLEKFVSFVGYIPDPDYLEHLLSADICVDPDPYSEYNDRSTMIKVMDYMSCGKPIVAFDLKETRRSAGDAAFYVKPNDEFEFAKALAYLMDHPEERAAMGRRGRERVERELSWASSAENLLRAYALLLPGVIGVGEPLQA